jgi:hypothetical protein
MTNNAIMDRFPQGTPMGGSRFRAQFTTTPDRFGPFAESMTLFLCAAGSNPLQWDNLINALAAKRRIELNEVSNMDVIVEKRLFLDELEKLNKASFHAEFSQVKIALDLSSSNFRDVLAQVCNQQRVAVLKSSKRDNYSFINLAEEIEEINPELKVNLKSQ